MARETRGWFALGSLLVAGLLMAGCQDATKIIGQDMTAVERGQQTLTVDAEDLALTVRGGVGQVEVRASERDGEVVVEYVKTAYSNSRAGADQELAAMALSVEVDGSQVTIDSRQPALPVDAVTNKVDLVIRVPGAAAVTIANTVGDVRVHDLTLSGALRLTADVGEVIVEGVDARDGVYLTARVGDVRFEGAVSADSEIHADVGAVTVELPAGAGVELDAATTVGKLTISGFNLGSAIKERLGTGADYRGALGLGGATLNLRANVGDITVRAASG